MTQRLNGKTAVITGGNSGIGLATAFVDEGATVFITGRRQAELEAAVKQLGPAATGVQGDVAQDAVLDRLYAAVDEIANAVVSLASGQSSYVTGTELLVDGGVNSI
jgi:NAD(P)-dependent dehydrogenase (short-subunit alcohol dehydrogenase family)